MIKRLFIVLASALAIVFLPWLVGYHFELQSAKADKSGLLMEWFHGTANIEFWGTGFAWIIIMTACCFVIAFIFKIVLPALINYIKHG